MYTKWESTLRKNELPQALKIENGSFVNGQVEKDVFDLIKNLVMRSQLHHLKKMAQCWLHSIWIHGHLLNAKFMTMAFKCMHACVKKYTFNLKHNGPLNSNNVKLLKLNMNGFHFDNFVGDCAKFTLILIIWKAKFCTYMWVYNTTKGY